MSASPPEPPALQSVQSADELYGRVVTRGRRLRRERLAFFATAGTAVIVLAAAVPIALSSDGGERVATTDHPTSTRPEPVTTVTSAPLTTEPAQETTVPGPVTPSTSPAVAAVHTTTIRRPTPTTARRPTPTTARPSPTSTTPPSPTTTVPATGAPTACTPTQPVATAGPGRVAFVRGGDIWSSDGDQATETNLTASTDSAEESPAYAPDRTRIAFVRSAGVFEMAATGGPATQLTDVFSGDASPAWSRDGALIAFVRDGDIWLVNATSGGAVKAIDVPDPLGSPTWSPDGCRLAFTWRSAVLTARTDGTGMFMVRDGASEPAWGLNNRIAVSALQGVTRDIFTIRPDGSDFVRLTTGQGSNPAWSSAGDGVAFQSTRSGNGDVYTIPYPAGAITRITFDSAADTDPTW
jgi:hypothetical protein